MNSNALTLLFVVPCVAAGFAAGVLTRPNPGATISKPPVHSGGASADSPASPAAGESKQSVAVPEPQSNQFPIGHTLADLIAAKNESPSNWHRVLEVVRSMSESELAAAIDEFPADQSALNPLACELLARWASFAPKEALAKLATMVERLANKKSERAALAHHVRRCYAQAGRKDIDAAAAALAKLNPADPNRAAAAAGLFSAIPAASAWQWLAWAEKNGLADSATSLMRKAAHVDPKGALDWARRQTNPKLLDAAIAIALRSHPAEAAAVARAHGYWARERFEREFQQYVKLLPPLEAARRFRQIFPNDQNWPPYWPWSRHFEWSVLEDPAILPELAKILPVKIADQCRIFAASLGRKDDPARSARLVTEITDVKVAAERFGALSEGGPELVRMIEANPALSLVKNRGKLFSLARTNPQAARDAMEALPPGPGRAAVAQELAMTLTDGRELLDLITREGLMDGDRLGDSTFARSELGRVLENLLEKSPEALATLLDSGNASIPAALQTQALAVAARAAPDAYIEECLRRGFPVDWSGWLGQAIQNSDLPTAQLVSLSQSLPADAFSLSGGEIISKLAHKDFPAAQSLLENSLQNNALSASQSEVAAVSIAERIRSRAGVAAAAAWAAALPTANASAPALATVIGSWVDKDVEAASDFINQLPAGPAKDAAIVPLCKKVWCDDPAAAWAWAVSASNPEAFLLSALQTIWSARNPNAAAAALRDANLSPEIRRRLEANLYTP